MIADLCTWFYEFATSWIPAWPSLGLDGGADVGPSPVEDGAPASATTEALARAREALAEMERAGGTVAASPSERPLDARFRVRGIPGAPAGAAGIGRLVLRLNEIDVSGLGARDREALRGAAEQLVRRLRD